MNNEQELKQLSIAFVKAFNEYDQWDSVMNPNNDTPLSSQTKMEIDRLVSFIKLNY
jgi:hypothetical protein